MSGFRSRAALLLSHALDVASAHSVVRFHALTHHVAEVMAHRLRISPERIDVIPRGRDPISLGTRSAARREAARALIGIRDQPLILAAARHERQKGLDVLIRAVPEVLAVTPNARFVIGGRIGTDTPLLQRLVDELNIGGYVEFIGPRTDVPELMCAADVFCVPSRWEGFGSVLIEAMALEVPTVASAIGPICEVGGPEPWLTLVPPDAPGHLAAGINELLTDPATAETRSRIGRDRFQSQYTAEVAAQRMAEFFRRSLAATRWNRLVPREMPTRF
jgi:glycosyltransferase involved in cell wall biosynthesis